MTGLIESFRDVLVNGVAPDPALLLPAVTMTVGLFALGVWYFRATESRFADVI
jgi:ABC-type polysaccharide/polyol phosphate export permease